ncbi:uncharacterized protein HMF8227_01052 [Saliniradius amylolyticus]|uniref:Methyltransferase type 11 domain-containing protein n=1 Tax=Saliniradius amylolyticus TaxID=2183582 RepID=A0A2S2E2Q6_9ALTE|nr:methyltransferase domain-containing protein [Saliniradius amylolyticus]AWL11540.1 uncharacterized protein HMF8227_01052 [Saliniradius amylolyticus]
MIPFAPALANNAPRAPKTWQDMPAGAQLKALLEADLAPLSRQWFGYHLVKMGALGAELSLPECPIKKQTAITAQPHPYGDMVSQLNNLPLQRRSVDAIVLPFTLDFCQDPHKLLRDVSRAIMADGHLVVLGLNPFSCAGFAKYWPFKPDSLLHEMRAFSTFRMRDWFNLLGYEVIEHHSMIHSELLFERKMNINSGYQRWMGRYLPGLASVYVMVGRKRRIPMTPNKAMLKPKPAFAASGAGLRAGRWSNS